MIAIFPEIAAASVARQFDTLGALIRQYFAGDKPMAPQLDMINLVRTAGMDFARSSGPMSGVGAIVARDVSGRVDVSMVLAPIQLSKAEESFLIAHLLGHWLLHIQPSIARGEWKTSGYSEPALPSTYFDHLVIGAEGLGAVDAIESDANQFALSLLIPRPMLERAFAKIQDPERLARFFQVPLSVVRCRMVQMGLIDAPAIDFSTAERRMGRGKSTPTLAGKELIHAIADKMATESPKAGVPRSFAASSYGTMQRQTEQPPSAQPEARNPAKTPTAVVQPQVKSVEKSATTVDAPAKPRMDRIRELARRMDPSVK
jgi:hypothetical protein